jgi:hypothetical protein
MAVPIANVIVNVHVDEAVLDAKKIRDVANSVGMPDVKAHAQLRAFQEQ